VIGGARLPGVAGKQQRNGASATTDYR